MKKYYVNYNTGRGNFDFEGTLQECKKLADEGVSYTQCGVAIYEGNRVVAAREWEEIGEPRKGEDVINFGYHGYYGAWTDI